MTTPWQPGFQGVTVVPPGYTDPHNYQPASALQNTWIPADNNLAAASDPIGCIGSQQIMTAGILYLVKIPVHQPVTVSNVCMAIQTGGTGASTGSFAGLYSATGTLLSGSADIGGSLLAAGPLAAPLTTPQTVQAGSFVWAALLANLATTQPTLRTVSSNSASTANAFLTAANFRAGANGSGLASLPASITLASNVAGIAFWIGLS